MLDKVDPTFREWVLARGGSWYTGDAWTQTGQVIRFKLPNINSVPLPKTDVIADSLLFTYHINRRYYGEPAVCWGWVSTTSISKSVYVCWLPCLPTCAYAWQGVSGKTYQTLDAIFGIAPSKDSGYNTVHYRLSLDLHDI